MNRPAVTSSSTSWDLILGYGRKRRGLKWATLSLIALFLLLPFACGVKQYRAARVIFDSAESRLQSYESLLERVAKDGDARFTSTVEELRLGRYPEISAIGLLDDQMRVSQSTPRATTGSDAGVVLGDAVRAAASASRDRGRAVMAGAPGPFGSTIVMPIYRDSRVPRALNDRRAAILGWSFVSVRPDTLIRQLAPDSRHVVFEIFDGTTVVGATKEQRTLNEGSAIGLRFQRQITPFGRTWLVRQQQRTYLGELFGSPLSLAAIAGLVIAALAWILLAFRRRSFEVGRRMLDVLVDVIEVVDADGCIAYASTSLTTSFGFTPDEVIGKPFLEFIHPQDQEALASALEQSKEQADHEIQLRRRCVRAKDGSWHYVEGTMRTIGKRGKRMGVLIVMHDVTDVLLLEEQVERAARIESLGRVAAQVAHEFNNVLMAIRTNVSVLQRRRADDPAVQASASRLHRSVTRGEAIAKEILRFGQPVEIAHKPIDIETWLRQLEDELRPLLPEAATLKVEVSEPVTVIGDPNQLSQVIVNLVVNARDALDEHDGFVVCSVERSEGGRFPFGVVPVGDFAHFEVRDNGKGMPPNVTRRVFEPLFTTKSKGTGLGLAICHQIVTAHHGLIFAESEEGSGTDMHIFLPALHDGTEAPDGREAAAV